MQFTSFVYLASPYTKFPRGMPAAAEEIGAIAAAFMRAGIPVFCPIAMGHALASKNEVPYEHDFWMGMDGPFMRAASLCVVAMLDGWQDSRGVLEEIETFAKMGKPVRFLPASAALTWPKDALVRWVRQ